MTDVGQGAERLDQKDEWGTVAGGLPPQSVADQARENVVKTPGSRTVPNLVHSAGLDLLDVPVELAEHPRYRVVQSLGKGGMALVYMAEHRMMKRAVALKVIASHLVSCSAAVERFRREVEAAARLNHPNIVTAFDAEQAGSCHFLVMELVDGVSLNRLVEQTGAFPPAVACEYARQAALGLEHAHEHGMVHRDIKPHNLMLTRGGQIKILDFGLTRFADDTSQEAPLTHWSSLTGTPDYIAPEQAANAHQADIRADIYGLGCTLYYLLTGRPPFPEGDAFEKVVAHMKHEPTPLADLVPILPPGLVQVIAQMMAKDPARRFQRPIEAARALGAFCQDLLPPVAGEQSLTPPPLLPSRVYSGFPERTSGPSTMGTAATVTGCPLDPDHFSGESAADGVSPRQSGPDGNSSHWSSALTVGLIVFVGFAAGGAFGLIDLFRPEHAQVDPNHGMIAQSKRTPPGEVAPDREPEAVPDRGAANPDWGKIQLDAPGPKAPPKSSSKKPKKVSPSKPSEESSKPEPVVPPARGQVVVRSKDATVEVAIRRGNLVVMILRPSMGVKELPAGNYQVLVVGGPGPLQGMTSRMAITGGGMVAVDVRPNGIFVGDASSMPPPPPDHPGPPPPPPPGPGPRKR